MMKLACNEIDPKLKCDYEATGETSGEVAMKMMEHVKSAHPEKMEEMSEEDMENMFMSKAHM